MLNENRKYSQRRRLEKSSIGMVSHSSVCELEENGGSPAADASPRAPRERDKSVLIPFTQESLWFESKRVLPVTCYVVPCKSDGRLLDKEALTVIVEPGDVDNDLTPSRDLEYGCLASLVSDDERDVLGAVLRNDGRLGLSKG